MTGMGTGRITTIWDQASGTAAPEGTAPGIVAVDACTACGEIRVTWADYAAAGYDVWHHHFDYCSGTDDRDPGLYTGWGMPS